MVFYPWYFHLHLTHIILLMNKQRYQESKVELYHYHYSHPFQKSIYLTKDGEQIEHPFSHKPAQPHLNKQSINPFENLERSQNLSKDKRLTISRVNTKPKGESFWDIFACCRDVDVVQSKQYDDCYVCNRRVFHNELQKPHTEEEEDVPYTSEYRLKSRQEKPIQVFYDKLKNHELAGERWTYQ